MLTEEQTIKLFNEYLRAKQTLSMVNLNVDNAIINYLKSEVRSMLFNAGYTIEECAMSYDIAKDLYERWK